jgi:hypothetical protein
MTDSAVIFRLVTLISARENSVTATLSLPLR